jgi:hypothetical protein
VNENVHAWFGGGRLETQVKLCAGRLPYSIEVKDEHEFEEHIVRFAYPEDVVGNALAARDELHRLAHSGVFPFDRATWSASRQS